MIAKEHSIYTIFAVTAEQYQNYKILGETIGSSSCGLLQEDSSNIVELVRDEYDVSRDIDVVTMFCML